MDSARERAQKVYRLLLNAYGKPRWEQKPPVDELIATILSQNTNDANRDRAYNALRGKYPTWEDVAQAPVRGIVAAIRPAGLGPQKGPRIRAVLRQIQAERGALDLGFLARLPVEEARTWLIGLPGVGPKTAAIVLLFSFDRPAFPVDTHIHRVTGRLELLPAKMTADAAHEHLARLFTADQYAAAHLNLIRLGRTACRARTPDCPHCPLRTICPYPRRHPNGGRKP
jgi:endonuclease-3